LQKNVRRGDVELAQRAATTLNSLDQLGAWRRLISIACEDIGAADIELVIDTIVAASSTQWHSEHGGTRVLADLVRRLTQSPKDRSADLLMLAARYHPDLGRMRDICRKSPLECRLRMICRSVAPGFGARGGGMVFLWA
jgi:replication-associated recombination protein RarA